MTRSIRVEPLIPRFQQIVGKSYVLTRTEEHLTYECDACLLIKAEPELVVLPKTSEQVAQIVRLCVTHQVPYIARGAGTGLSGGALPIEGGVIIGLNRMNDILEIDTENRTATVEVGVVNARLNEALSSLGLFYAPDPSSQSACTLGGNIAENAGGIHCIKYGVTTDHILGLEVILPDGTLTWIGGKTRRVHGINWLGLLVGSEGTLGIITKATVRLLPRPSQTQTFLLAFAQVQEATQTVSQIIASGVTPAALEFMDAFTVRAVNTAFQIGFPENCEAVLLVELDGPALAVQEEVIKLKEILTQCVPLQIKEAQTPEERYKLWEARKKAVAAYGRILPAFYLHDCVIPRRKLTEVLEKINHIGQTYRITIGNVFHAGDGNLHPNILFDPDDSEMVARVLAGGEEILKACLEAGGTLSGEHGIGVEKAHYMSLIFSEQDLAKMHSVKTLLDPYRLANPGKIIPTRKGCGEIQSHIANPLTIAGEVWI